MPIPPLHQFPDKSDFYVRSTPKSPLDPSAVAFSKPIPAIVQSAKTNAYYISRLKQHLADFDKDLAEWKESGEWKKEYKTWGAACEIALGMARRAANKIISQYKETEGAALLETGQNWPAEADAEKAETLEKLSVRPDPNSPDFNPMADIEARMPEHIKGKATPKSEPLENGESEEDYEKPRVVTHEVPEVPKDMDGTVIPKKLLSVWNRRDEVQSAMTLASKLRTLIKDLAGQSSEKGGKTDPLYSGMGWQAAITALNSIYYQFSEVGYASTSPGNGRVDRPIICWKRLRDFVGRAMKITSTIGLL